MSIVAKLANRYRLWRQARHEYAALLSSIPRDRFAAFFDFGYQHYALGDVLTTMVNLACQAEDAKCNGMDIYIHILPYAPSAPQQGHITPDNYLTHLDNLFPAFLCNPLPGALRLLRDYGLQAGLVLEQLHASGVSVWPSLEQHLRRQMNYPMGHALINGFHKQHGRLPQLGAPRGYDRWAKQLRDTLFKDRFLVCVNPRQSGLTTTPSTIYRDAPMDEWIAFFGRARRTHPDVHFVMLGAYAEADRRLLALENVTILRALGYGLAHELALLANADMFMGTSSGFATMATFSGAPYFITGVEPVFSHYAEIPVGATAYPFAKQHQYLHWAREDAAMLLDYLGVVHAANSPLMQLYRKKAAAEAGAAQ
ncbi:hypothetical protein [Ferrovibrio sp.]|uniref:hypothetical protein n=1 Tax=Ferrovibrio sp. TaxID=1917215 RepID=UPI0025C06DE1|nr:hypothetical protein [Ferrovibrio sp.]MBX3454265.1 hypothetical protein [Ferrovibrio sp.]